MLAKGVLGSHWLLLFGKATKVGSPPNFSKLISQLWGIPQLQYFITLSLDPHWTYFLKHYRYIYYKKTPKLVAKILATKFGFVPDCSLKFVPEGPINNIPSLVQIMAWRRSGDNPLFEPMTVRLSTYICVTWPQWVNRQHISIDMSQHVGLTY